VLSDVATEFRYRGQDKTSLVATAGMAAGKVRASTQIGIPKEPNNLAASRAINIRLDDCHFTPVVEGKI
jgi:hypothetical protein